MRKIVLLFVLISSYAFSQSVNDYQYVIVPAKFSVFKENNRYNLNTTTKLLLEKYGFKAYLSTDEIPDNISNCQKLYADLVQDNDFMITRIKLVLKDCKEAIVYETAFGKSREKDYQVAYNQALRETAKSFDKLNYKYNGKKDTIANVVETNTVVTSNKSESVTVTTSLKLEPLFAKPYGENGYQLLTNNTDIPRHVMTIYKTSSPDCYLVNNGVLLRKPNGWYLEYYKENKLVSELISIVNLN